MSSCIALIPARAGSKRVNQKNIKLLNGHPLLAYTIAAAHSSGSFTRVIVSTDSEAIATIAKQYGAEVPWLRPSKFAQDTSPDIEWLRYTLQQLQVEGSLADAFALLRPTSPFRKPETIQRARQQFLAEQPADSLRAVELCTQHPAKMWSIIEQDHRQRLQPIMPNPDATATPWHSTPYQALPKIYVQNASLEIAWCNVPLEQGTISGKVIVPFFTNGYEGFDINNQADWILAEHALANNLAHLPTIALTPHT